MNLKKSLVIAGALGVMSISVWELYWRSQGEFPVIDGDPNLWATQRHKIANLTENDIVITGSSRVLFGIQLDTFEQETGISPIQLAIPGSSPLPVFNDLIENTDFKGTIIVGVTPGLFFSSSKPGKGPWGRAQKNVEHFKKQTYAQKFNHFLSLPLQKNFAFVSRTSEGWANQIDLKALLKKMPTVNRTGKELPPPFNRFGLIDERGNLYMDPVIVTDTLLAKSVIKVWAFGRPDNGPEHEKDAVLSLFNKKLDTFQKRGGKVILVRAPSSGSFREFEAKFFAKSQFWDQLVATTGVSNYHFEEHEAVSSMPCPEESHISREDAQFFTVELIKTMQKENLLNTSK